MAPDSFRAKTSLAKASLTTTVSSKGQVVLPKTLRDSRHWAVGTTLQIENTEEGVLLKAMPVFTTTESSAVFGMLRHDGPPKTVEEMNAAISREVKRRHARDRY